MSRASLIDPRSDFNDTLNFEKSNCTPMPVRTQQEVTKFRDESSVIRHVRVEITGPSAEALMAASSLDDFSPDLFHMGTRRTSTPDLEVSLMDGIIMKQGRVTWNWTDSGLSNYDSGLIACPVLSGVVKLCMCMSFSFLLFIEGTSWRPWHFDFQEDKNAGDTLATLLYGRKLWMMSRVDRPGGRLVQLRGDMRTPQAITKYLRYLKNKSHRELEDIKWCAAEAGSTVHMPYGEAHSVAIFCEPHQPSRMVSVDLEPRPLRVNFVTKSAQQSTATGSRKKVKSLENLI